LTITFYKGPQLVPTLSQMNPFHIFPPYFPNINSNIIFPSMVRGISTTFRLYILGLGIGKAVRSYDMTPSLTRLSMCYPKEFYDP